MGLLIRRKSFLLLKKLLPGMNQKHAGLARKNIKKLPQVWELATLKQIKHAATISKTKASEVDSVTLFHLHAKETTKNSHSFNASDAWVQHLPSPLKPQQPKTTSMRSTTCKKSKHNKQALSELSTMTSSAPPPLSNLTPPGKIWAMMLKKPLQKLLPRTISTHKTGTLKFAQPGLKDYGKFH